PRTMHLGRLQAFQAPPTSHPDLDAVAIPATLRPQVAAVLHASQRRPVPPTQQFDIAGRPVALRDVWGTEERTVYSPLGEPIMIIDADGRSVRREYGSWSLKLREADPSG